MSLLEEYKKLSSEYDKVLNLSKMILAELKKEGKESNLFALLEKKKMAGKGIARLTKEVASTEIKSYSDSNLKTLATGKVFSSKSRKKQSISKKLKERYKISSSRKTPSKITF